MATSPISGLGTTSLTAAATGTAVGGTSGTSTTGEVGTLPASDQLNESDFLTLLSAELEYQNPSSPVDDTQFISELAQFSSLSASNQQEQTLTQILSQLSSGTGPTALLSAAQLIGKTVTTSSSTTGQISGVTLDSAGNVQVELSGGTAISLADITGVSGG